MAALRRCLEEGLAVEDPAASHKTFVAELTNCFAPDSGAALSVGANEWDGVREVAVELHKQILRGDYG